jgi:hypothetical protein
MDLLNMDFIWGHFKKYIPRGRSLCDHLNVDFVGVKFEEKYNQPGTFKRVYYTVADFGDVAGNRSGNVYVKRHATLQNLLRLKGQPHVMSYSDFMNIFVWSKHYYCSRVLLDI